MQKHSKQSPLKVLIVGAGLGGLSCAISCLKAGLDVQILEKSKELKEVGAGIQVPPNAMRMLDHYSLIPRLIEAGAVKIGQHRLMRYSNGEVICSRTGTKWMVEHFGYDWYVVHRADYHQVFLNEARQLGAKIRLDCDVSTVDFESPFVVLSNGQQFHADVIIGADGLRSAIRPQLLKNDTGPIETGDLAYRVTINTSQIKQLKDPALDALIETPAIQTWIGPNRHAVLYPIRNELVYNMVLVRPDNLSSNVFVATGEIGEMRETFKGWDPRLAKLISLVDNVAKWKICHMHELDTWVKGSLALLGDACHPTLPYQSQGAAMAVEDGAALGVLLGLLSRSVSVVERGSRIHEILELYQSMRKSRTTTNVQGAIQDRILFHMEDGSNCEARNMALRSVDWHDPQSKCEWGWANLGYMKSLMGFDTVTDAIERFKQWREADKLD